MFVCDFLLTLRHFYDILYEEGEVNILNERIKELRRTLNLTQQEFADRIGVKRNTVATYEGGRNTPIDSVVSLICREFNVNEEWLRTGQGEMFKAIPEEDEVAVYVSDLLESNGENDFYNIIIEVMRTYDELDEKSKKVLMAYSERLMKNLGKRKEG